MRRSGRMLALSVLLLAAAGCGRQERKSTGSSDTAAVASSVPGLGIRVSRATDPVLMAMARQLREWSSRWGSVLPGFSLDSLYREPPRLFHFASAYARAIGPDDLKRARTFGSASPDSSRIVEPNLYREFVDGRWELWGEPDSSPALIDLTLDSLFVLTTVGPDGGFEGAFWIDRECFVVVGYAERVFDPWSGGGDLWVHDLANHTSTYYHTPSVAKAAYDRYLELSYAAQTKRVGVEPPP